MNRIDQKFQALRHEGVRAFMPYLCGGSLNLELTSKLLLTLEEVGLYLLRRRFPVTNVL